MRNFPNLIDGYMAYSSGHESTIRVRKWCIVAAIAAALERKVWLDRGYYTLFPNLYTFIIGRSGLVKKTTSTGIAVNLLREVEGIRIMSERITAGALIEQLVLAGKKFEANGREYRQSAVFAYASELSVFLEEVFGNITPLLTTFYDCVPHDSSKPWVYGTIGRGERKIYGPCLNILGASTKAWLKRCIPTSEMEGGFSSRIIFVVENNLPEELVAWPEPSEAMDLDKLKLVDDLRQVHRLSGPMTITASAKALFKSWYHHHMREVLPYNSDPKMVGYMSRKGDTILKIAMVHSVSRGDTLNLTEGDLVWANKEIDLLEMDWRLAFSGLGGLKGLAFEIGEYVKKKGCARKEELVKMFCQLHPMPEIAKALHDLKNMDEIEEMTVKENGQDVDVIVSPGYLEVIRLGNKLT